MRLWNRGRETELERQLRAQRPQPRAELVQRISRESATPRSHRSLIPRIALVGAVILLLAASLGAAGALGNATKSVETFGHSVLHVAQSPFHSSTDSKSGKNVGSHSGNQSGDHQGNGNDNGNNGNGNGNGTTETVAATGTATRETGTVTGTTRSITSTTTNCRSATTAN